MGLHALAFLAGNLAAHWLITGADDCLWWRWLVLGGFLLPRWRWLGSAGLGLVVASLSIHNALDHRWPMQLDGQHYRFEVVIEDFPRPQHWGGAAVPGRIVRAPGMPAVRQLQLIFPPWLATPEPGQRWQVKAQLQTPQGRANPHAFDREHQFAVARLDGQASVEDAVLLSHRPFALDSLRARLAASLSRAMTAPTRDWLLAILLGDRRGLNDARFEVLQRTGTAHLMAISGMHVGMVAAIGVGLGQALLWLCPGWLRGSARKQWALTLGAACALVYAGMAGFSLPTVRAVLMLAVAVALLWLRWRWWASELLAVALVVVLLFDPLASISVGFWLSFLAVAVLLMVALPADQTGAWRRLWQVQWRLPLVMAPVSALFFGLVSLIAPVANMVAVPVVTLLVLPLALAGCLSWGLLGWDMPLEVAGAGMRGLVRGLAWVSDFPAAAWQPAARPWPLLVLLFAGLLGLALPLSWRLRSSFLLLVLPACLYQPPRADFGHWQARLFDVGHGQALAITTQHHLLVYDVGPSWPSGGSAMESLVTPTLRAEGWQRIRLLLLSQGDDHHAGGYPQLLADWPVAERAYAPVAPHAQASHCHAGQSWQWDGVRFAILHPPRSLPALGDDSSCVLLVESQRARMLVMGDAGTAVEPAVLRALDGRRVDVLVAGRHGSMSATSEGFLRALAARRVLVAGEPPDRALMPGVTWQDTHRSGALSITPRGAARIELSAWRGQARRWWRRSPQEMGRQ